MKFRTALTAMAATGLVIAPVAAQAATRASSSSVVNLAQGNGPKGVQESSLKRRGFGNLPRGVWIPLLAGAAIIGFILIDDEGNVTRSPGAN